MEAIKIEGFVIKYVENPTEEMQLEAIKQSISNSQYIKNKTNKIKNIMLQEGLMNIDDLINDMLLKNKE